MIYVLIGFSGMIGALLRYGLSLMLDFSGGSFPLATLVGNLLGSFVLGWFTTRIQKTNAMRPQLLTAIGAGLIGSFTTFSTFSLETVTLFRDSDIGMAFLYVIFSLILGLAAAWSGYKLGDHLIKTRQEKEVTES